MTAATLHSVARFIVIALVIHVSSPVAAATKRGHKASTQRARKEFRLGKKAAELGHFDVAITHFEKAYDLERVPAILFNIGQCQRYLKHYDRALYFFEEYLREEPEATDRAIVEQDIADTRRERDQSAPVEPEAPTRPEEPTTTAIAATSPTATAATGTSPTPMTLDAPATTPSTDPMNAVMTAPSPEPASSPLWTKWWVWAAAGAVVAGAVTAVLLTRKHDTIIEPSGSLGTADAR